MSFNFVAAITICSDFRAPKNKVSLFSLFPHLFPMKWGQEKLLHLQGQEEEISFVQGKEQWLRFAGVAVKRYPTSKVRETQVRR